MNGDGDGGERHEDAVEIRRAANTDRHRRSRATASEARQNHERHTNTMQRRIARSRMTEDMRRQERETNTRRRRLARAELTEDEQLNQRTINTSRRREIRARLDISVRRSSRWIAGGRVDDGTVTKNELPVSRTCLKCEARRFPFEPETFCCGDGNVHLTYHPPPPSLLQLCNNSTDFRHNIRAYNAVFAFTSMGVSLDTDLANGRNGVYTFRAHVPFTTG
ncbi:hypothetical protein BC829DRAFT_458300 [Chytridium lagenaria]|nr:hypothetical protein BC829DRAFT_458300 [Chytridium lagenaria]